MILWHSRKDAKCFRSCPTNRKDGDEIKSRNKTKIFLLIFGMEEYGTPPKGQY
jgi:hypothetical protein